MVFFLIAFRQFLAINFYFIYYFEIRAGHFFDCLMAFVAEVSIILFQKPPVTVYINFYKDALKILAF